MRTTLVLSIPKQALTAVETSTISKKKRSAAGYTLRARSRRPLAAPTADSLTSALEPWIVKNAAMALKPQQLGIPKLPQPQTQSRVISEPANFRASSS